MLSIMGFVKCQSQDPKESGSRGCVLTCSVLGPLRRAKSNGNRQRALSRGTAQHDLYFRKHSLV